MSYLQNNWISREFPFEQTNNSKFLQVLENYRKGVDYFNTLNPKLCCKTVQSIQNCALPDIKIENYTKKNVHLPKCNKNSSNRPQSYSSRNTKHSISTFRCISNTQENTNNVKKFSQVKQKLSDMKLERYKQNKRSLCKNIYQTNNFQLFNKKKRETISSSYMEDLTKKNISKPIHCKYDWISIKGVVWKSKNKKNNQEIELNNNNQTLNITSHGELK